MSEKQFLEKVADRINNGERLTREDGLRLFQCRDLLQVGLLARSVKKRKSGNYVFFNVNRHINLTNVCHSLCQFCAFGREADAAGAYTMTCEEALAIGREAAAEGATELHIVSALHPDRPFSYYRDILAALHAEFPQMQMQAFTAVEIEHFSRISGLSIEEVLKTLKEAGLIAMPGGGAEVFSSRVRDKLCPRKASGERWLEIMETAHRLGIKTNATMLYGHIETLEERVDHLIALRELQDRTGGFQAFIPLKFHPENTALSHIQPTTAFEDLQLLAISRLMLDNFDHIKAFWIMLGVDVAQISLNFGADDLDGTVIEEKITHAAGARTALGITRDQLLTLIRQTGLVPVERDTLYNVLKVYGEGD